MIRSVNIKSSFSMYTNPGVGEVYIDFESGTSSAYYKIVNTEGHIVYQNNNPIIRNTVTLNMFPTGIYTIEVGNKDIVKTKKFLRL